MKNRTIKAAGLLGFALLLAGSVMATDSSFYWSDASGARGTLYWDSICLSNSTFGGTIVSGTTLSGNGSGLTNLNAGYLTAGNAGVDRITNAALTLGPYIAGNIPVAAITNAGATLGPYVKGNIPVASITNAAGSLGPSIAGNIPQAAITNAAATLGPYIGGNIPQAAMTNVLVLYVPLTDLTNAIPPLSTNDCYTGVGGVTNRVIFNVYGVKISSTQL